jgi:hypothetical protein
MNTANFLVPLVLLDLRSHKEPRLSCRVTKPVQLGTMSAYFYHFDLFGKSYFSSFAGVSGFFYDWFPTTFSC